MSKRVSLLGYNFSSCAILRLVVITIFAVHVLSAYLLKLLNDKLLRPKLFFLFLLDPSGGSVKLPQLISGEFWMLTENVYAVFFVISVFADLAFFFFKLKMWERWISIGGYVVVFMRFSFSVVLPGRIPNEKYSLLMLSMILNHMRVVAGRERDWECDRHM